MSGEELLLQRALRLMHLEVYMSSGTELLAIYAGAAACDPRQAVPVLRTQSNDCAEACTRRSAHLHTLTRPAPVPLQTWNPGLRRPEP